MAGPHATALNYLSLSSWLTSNMQCRFSMKTGWMEALQIAHTHTTPHTHTHTTWCKHIPWHTSVKSSVINPFSDCRVLLEISLLNNLVHALHQQAFCVQKQGGLRVVNHSWCIHVLRCSYPNVSPLLWKCYQSTWRPLFICHTCISIHVYQLISCILWTNMVSHLASANCGPLFYLHNSSYLEL